MKTLFSVSICFLAIVTLSSLPSCTKEKIVTVIDTDTVTIRIVDTLRTVFNDTSKLGLLTRKQWVIDSAYTGYTGPGTGTLIYARGASNNTYNYDLVRSIFWIGGNEDHFNTIGAHYSLTWYFNSSDSTSLTATSSQLGTYQAKILKLDATHLTLHDLTNNVLDIQVYKP
jgi:hypothetical protein